VTEGRTQEEHIFRAIDIRLKETSISITLLIGTRTITLDREISEKETIKTGTRMIESMTEDTLDLDSSKNRNLEEGHSTIGRTGSKMSSRSQEI
jgi:hypothetical protein